MTTLIICVRRATHVTHEYFEAYWRDSHGPLVTSVSEFTRHLRSYRQFHLIDYKPAMESEPASEFDGIAVLSFEDAEAMQAAFQEPRFLNVLAPDTYNFADLEHSPQFVVCADGSQEQATSRHGSITVFEFAGPARTPALQSWTANGSQNPRPAAVERYKTIAPEGVNGSTGEPPTYITACSFTKVEEASRVLISLTEQGSGQLSVGRKPIHAIAREHVFL
jgi:uncharacterized protein (TIGR02118 family)